MPRCASGPGLPRYSVLASHARQAAPVAYPLLLRACLRYHPRSEMCIDIVLASQNLFCPNHPKKKKQPPRVRTCLPLRSRREPGRDLDRLRQEKGQGPRRERTDGDRLDDPHPCLDGEPRQTRAQLLAVMSSPDSSPPSPLFGFLEHTASLLSYMRLPALASTVRDPVSLPI